MVQSKYLFMADVHLSNKLPNALPLEDNHKTDRFVLQLQMLKDIAEIGEKHDVDGYIVLGDLFDKSVVDPVTFFESAKAFKKCFKKPVYVLPGNHDSVTISGGPYVVDIFELLGMNVVTHEQTFGDKRVTFYPLEYVSVDNSRQRLEELRGFALHNGPEYNSILLFHNTVVGAQNGKYVSDTGLSPAELSDGFDFALGGHFHEPHMVSDKVAYCGAPMQHHFGDCGKETGVMVGTFTEDGADFERIDLVGPKFFQYDTLDIDFELHSHDYVRASIECTVPELHQMAEKIQATKKEAASHGVHFFFCHKPISHHELRIESTTDGLSYGALVDEYIKMPDVNKGKLSEKKLAKYGREILERAMQKNGNN